MADLAAKKSNAISKIVYLANLGMACALQIAELEAFLTDNGLLAGGANALSDADFQGENGHITAVDLNNAMPALRSITLNGANKTLLRKINKSSVPTLNGN